MGNVGEGAAVNESWRPFQSLNQVGIDSVLKECGHRSISFNIASIDRPAIRSKAYQNVADPGLQVL